MVKIYSAILSVSLKCEQTIKAAFHYSSQLQTWFLTRFAARFSTSFVTTLSNFFVENLVANHSRFAGSCAC